VQRFDAGVCTSGPVEVAVACGAAGTAHQLVTAGASCLEAFEALTTLAERLAGAAGGWDSAAAVAEVPPAVQRMAAALLADGLPAGEPAAAVHKVAVNLAYPRRRGEWSFVDDVFPPCPWLLKHLLQLHTSGQLAPAAACAPAVLRLLFKLAQRERGPAANASLLQWLKVPAVAALPAGDLRHLCLPLCHAPRLGPLQAVLQREDVQQELRDGVQDGVEPAELVLNAAQSSSTAVLDALLAAGASIGMGAVAHLVQHSRGADGGLSALQLVLSRGVPAVPPEGPLDACPIYLILEGWRDRQQAVGGPSFCVWDEPGCLCAAVGWVGFTAYVLAWEPQAAACTLISAPEACLCVVC